MPTVDCRGLSKCQCGLGVFLAPTFTCRLCSAGTSVTCLLMDGWENCYFGTIDDK